MAESELSAAGVTWRHGAGGGRFGITGDGIVVGDLGTSISSLMVGTPGGCVINRGFHRVTSSPEHVLPSGGALPHTVPSAMFRCKITDPG